MNQLNNQYVENVVKQLSDASLDDILEWTFETFGDDVAMTTAFGYSGVFLLHHILRYKPDMAVYFIDTGYHFPETLEFAACLQREWNLNLKIIRPLRSKEEQQRLLGTPTYRHNPDMCCYYNKVEPLLSFIKDKSVWFSAIRRDQSPTRANINVVQQDGRGILKVHPLYRWTGKRIWDYLKKYDIPYHPLHDENYISIGCKPCTLPVRDTRNEREGRWPHLDKVECGINYYPNKY